MSSVAKAAQKLITSANSLTDLFSAVPSGKEWVGTVFITNQNNSNILYRFAHAIGGEADNRKQYLAYDDTLEARRTAWYKVCLSATDLLRGQANQTNVSYVFEGIERTISA